MVEDHDDCLVMFERGGEVGECGALHDSVCPRLERGGVDEHGHPSQSFGTFS